MYVRVKKVGSRRYAYLVSGKRDDRGRVRQSTLCYLGSFARLSMGVPLADRRRVAKRLGSTRIDWDEINMKLRKIPVTYEEMNEQRRLEYNSWVKRSKGNIHRTRGRTRPRAKGELEALSRIAKLRFEEMFEEVGPREYRMR